MCYTLRAKQQSLRSSATTVDERMVGLLPERSACRVPRLPSVPGAFCTPRLRRSAQGRARSHRGPVAADELAFLALTSKIELPIRDRLAYTLFRRLPELLVTREWRPVDLAVLSPDGKTPVLLLEAKALYTFNFVTMTERRASPLAGWPDRATSRIISVLGRARVAEAKHGVRQRPL